MRNYDPPIRKHLEENKKGIKAAKALWAGEILGFTGKGVKSRHVVVSSAKVHRLNKNPIFFPERASSAEGPDPCELAQNPRYRKGPDVCFDYNENVRHKHVCASVQGWD